MAARSRRASASRAASSQAPPARPATVEVPLRVAVVQGGVGEKVIASKAYRTTVEMSEGGSVPFTFVAEDLSYPVPSAAVADNYIFYVGFDPQALAPEPKARGRRSKARQFSRHAPACTGASSTPRRIDQSQSSRSTGSPAFAGDDTHLRISYRPTKKPALIAPAF